MKDVVVVYREELGKVEGCAGDDSRRGGGCHYDCGKERIVGERGACTYGKRGE